MSRWTHSICVACWNKKNPHREPVVIRDTLRDLETCCFCSQEHRSGIFVRENPADMPCNGIHKGDS